jgi:phospholipase C
LAASLASPEVYLPFTEIYSRFTPPERGRSTLLRWHFASHRRGTNMLKRHRLGKAARAVAMAAAVGVAIGPAGAGRALARAHHGSGGDPATPIEHVVVIFQENVSFDHYFATYPKAENPPGEPPFSARGGTPTVNGLGTLVEGEPSGALLTSNPNANNSANGTSAINPFRLDRTQASTCDQDHNYGAEQSAFDEGLMDLFPISTGCSGTYAWGKGSGITMGYFDGNTVTALWNYAQHFAMSDNAFGTTFGPSTPGALNVVAGTTYPATLTGTSPKVIVNTDGEGTLVGDLDPTGDVCSGGATVRMGGQNIGDLLNANGISWGSFMGGFDLTIKNPDGSTGCGRQSPATPANGGPVTDYIPHHAWFQYWASTANLNHTRPSVPPSEYGTSADTGANHEYDIHDFFDALNAGNLPAVSFIKAPANMDGHAGYSDPLLEQKFIVNLINTLEKSPFWSSTAVFINWDDSDGWYDHQMNPIVNPSAEDDSTSNGTPNPGQYGDNLNGSGKCGNGTPLKDNNGNVIEGRCGYGPRIPLMVISPWAKANFVAHTVADQSSILRFIEDNWGTGRIGNGSYDALAGSLDNVFDFSEDNGTHARRLFLDPRSGEPVPPL